MLLQNFGLKDTVGQKKGTTIVRLVVPRILVFPIPPATIYSLDFCNSCFKHFLRLYITFGERDGVDCTYFIKSRTIKPNKISCPGCFTGEFYQTNDCIQGVNDFILFFFF